MNELDTILMRLADTPLPAALAAIDQGVFQGVAAQRELRVRRKVGAMSISAALLIGVLSTAVRSGAPADSLSLDPLGTVSTLSPASILGNL